MEKKEYVSPDLERLLLDVKDVVSTSEVLDFTKDPFTDDWRGGTQLDE